MVQEKGASTDSSTIYAKSVHYSFQRNKKKVSNNNTHDALYATEAMVEFTKLFFFKVNKKGWP